MERRRKGSGQVSEVPCPACGVSVELDPRSMELRADQSPILTCQACGASVPIRHTDVYRPVPPGADQPDDGAPAARGRHFRRKG